MQQQQETPEAPAAPRAKGRWTKEKTTVQHLAAEDTVEIHTFTATSGHTAIMKRTLGSGREPYTAQIRTPEGNTASRVNENGHRITAMTIHLKQRDARLTVEEAVSEIQRQTARSENEPSPQK